MHSSTAYTGNTVKIRRALNLVSSNVLQENGHHSLSVVLYLQNSIKEKRNSKVD